MEEEQIINERKDKVIKFFKEKYSLLSYLVLAFIVFLAVRIRSINLPGLRDITTGGWTLAQDLDPYLALRWAKYIVAHGSLMVLDTMRYVPLGYGTSGELTLWPYAIAWFHNIAVYFGSTSVEQSAAIYPIVMFGFTVIAFFFLTRKMFADNLGELKANIIALAASFFLSVIPALLPRTIGGIPEKESTGFLLIFLALYFFLSAWKSKSNIGKYSLALLAGVSTAAMALIWGGFGFIIITIAVSIFLALILSQVNREKFYIYSLWLFSSFALMMPFSTRYTLKNLISSTITGAAVAIVFLLFVDLFVMRNSKIKTYIENSKLAKIPIPLLSLIASAIIGIAVILVFFGPTFITSNFQDVISNLIRPVSTRLGVTVAENKQPFFGEWAGNFGPSNIGSISTPPILFWMFFIGSIYLFYHMTKVFHKKERNILTISFVVFLTALIFSRYSSSSLLNGENTLSLMVYALGFIALLGTFGFYYYKYYKAKEENKLKEIDFGLIMIFAFFFFGVVAARGAVRTIMVLVPSVSILVSYLAVSLVADVQKVKDGFLRFIAWIFVAIMLIAMLSAGYQYFQTSEAMASYNVKVPLPGYQPTGDVLYSQQWQKAMAWVRDNTPTNAVFGHWWDYGYWLQTIGERATVLDGGNAIPYWDYLMGRYGLTTTNNTEALEFLYAHNTTHFLIDSTDIGKYSAFSSIGSNENYDRASYIPGLALNTQQTQETKNSTIYFFQGGIGLDEDLIYYQNGTKIFLPGGKAGLAGIFVEKDKSDNLVSQPIGVFVYQNKRYDLPMRYAFDHKFTDFGTGIDAGVFLMSSLSSGSGSLALQSDGALLYLSSRTVRSQLARLYLYDEDHAGFKLVHTEDDLIVAQIKAQNKNFTDDFVYYGGVRGPIKIWEIQYSQNMVVKQEYLLTDYPSANLSNAK